MKTLTYRLFGDVIVVYQAKENPSDEEWDLLIEYAVNQKTTNNIDKKLIVTAGGGPTAMQRQRMAAAYKKVGYKVTTAVMTDSFWVRGIITAMEWLGAPIRSFTNSQMEPALEYVGLSRDQLPAVEALIDEFRRGVEDAPAAEPV